MTEIVRQPVVFDLIDGLLGFFSNLLETHPDQDCAADIVANDTNFTGLTAFQFGYLFGFPIKLLNLPTQVACIFYGLGIILSEVVRHDIFRALGR